MRLSYIYLVQVVYLILNFAKNSQIVYVNRNNQFSRPLRHRL